MNPGTYYLYEYDNTKRTRNVGFIRVTHRFRSCILQIQARGLPLRESSSLELIAFYREQDRLFGTVAAAPDRCGKALSLRLTVSETSFPDSRPLSRIDGFILRRPGSSLHLFWMASAFFFDVKTDMLRLPAEGPSVEESASPAETPVEPPAEESAPPADAPEANVPVESPAEEPAPPANAPEANVPVAPPAEEPAPPADTPEAPSTEEPASVDPSVESAESASCPHVKKIRRSDLSILPRRFWHLADNSFLLHGCRSYGHLLLIEEDGRMWLGVPGIYDAHEARAADLFGFPRFTRAYVSAAGLSKEERNDGADFGHWCRCVGPGSMA